jgi:hypothetical protein
MVSPNAIDDQLFRSEVRLSNQIQFALIGYLQSSPEPFRQQPSGIARSLNSKVKQTNSLYFRKSKTNLFLFQDISEQRGAANGLELAGYFAPMKMRPLASTRTRNVECFKKAKLRSRTKLSKKERYSMVISRPSGFRLETKQLERVPAFGPSTRRTIALADESLSLPTLSTTTRCPSGVTKK